MDPEASPAPESLMGTLLKRMEERSHENWVEPLVGRTCSRITIDRFDPVLVLSFLYDGPAAWVQINSPLRLWLGDESWQIDPVDDRNALGPVLSLISRAVTVAVAQEDGLLRLEFEGGAVVEVAPSADGREAWWFDLDDRPEQDPPDK